MKINATDANITANMSLICDFVESISGNIDKKELKSTKKIRRK
jgi:hypothetical protein